MGDIGLRQNDEQFNGGYGELASSMSYAITKNASTYLFRSGMLKKPSVPPADPE
jgi:hypothetical protein